MLRATDSAIAVSVALAAVLYLTGGFRLDLPWARVGLHDWTRALAITAALVALRMWWSPWRRDSQPEQGALPALPDVARVMLLAASLTSVGYWLMYLTMVCGGSDSYSYVSASRLLLHGKLIQPQDVSAWLPVVDPLDVATPAGYVATADRTGIAPAYPLGLPALMALATLLAGSLGPYLVAPACGVASLVLVWRMGTAWYGPVAGWLAAAIVAWDPLVVTYAKQPMSDVPATMWTLLAVWCLTGSRQWPLAAGLAAGASFLTRPGGVGLLVVLAAVAAWTRDRHVRSLVRFASGVAPCVLLLAFLHWRLFGSPLASGYGSIASLFAGATVWGNAGIYLDGMFRTHSWLWFAGVAAAWFAPSRMPVALGSSMLLVSGIPYLLYFQFDHWETLRFLMPAMVVLSIAAAGGIVTVTARLRPLWVPSALAIVCALAVAAQSERFLRREGVPRLREAEMRYPLVAARLQQTTDTRAVVLAAQHSGSIRHYAARLTLRWDLMRPEDLEPATAALRARGHPVYVALEGTEQQRFASRFAEPLTRLHLYPFGRVRDTQLWEIVP